MMHHVLLLFRACLLVEQRLQRPRDAAASSPQEAIILRNQQQKLSACMNLPSMDLRTPLSEVIRKELTNRLHERHPQWDGFAS